MITLNIDKAINHAWESAANLDEKAMCVEEAYQTTKQQEYEERAKEYRQIAEWLTELKDLRDGLAEVKVQTETLDHLFASKAINEAKLVRLLKLAVNCLNDGGCTKDCDMCINLEDCICEKHDNSFKWKHTDEAMKLIERADIDG